MTTNAETKPIEEHPGLNVPADWPRWLQAAAHALALTGDWGVAASAASTQSRGEGVNVHTVGGWAEREPYRDVFAHARALGSAALMADIEQVVVDMAKAGEGTVSLRAAALLKSWHGGPETTAQRIGLSSLLNAGKGDSGNPAVKKGGKKSKGKAPARKAKGGEGGTSS